MAYAIRVQTNNETEQYLFKKEFNSQDKFQAIVNLCGENKRRIDPFESLVMVTRTDTISNFCKDFFFPTLTNCALKINNTALRVLMIGLTAAADICTFPVRVITLIPRHLYNSYHSKESHPFYQYLIKNGVAPASLNAGHVFLELRWPAKNHRRHDFSWKTFNFMQLPAFESPILYTLGNDYPIRVTHSRCGKAPLDDKPFYSHHVKVNGITISKASSNLKIPSSIAS